MSSEQWTGPSVSLRQSGDGDKTLWAQEVCQIFPMGAKHRLLRFRRSGTEVVLDLNACNILLQCRNFRTLDEHARAIGAGMGGGAEMRSRLRALLNDFAKRGLLRPATDLLDELRRAPAEPEPDPLRTVVIRTCDRHDALKALLESAVANERRHGQQYTYWVIDDSRDDRQLAANRELVDGLAGRGVLALRYHGPREQAALVERLAERLPAQRATIEWLLMPGDRAGIPTPGRAVNHALLLTVGERLVLLDDDILLDVREPPGAEPGVQIGTVPRSCHFFTDRDEMLRTTATLPLDPFERHGSVLGLPLAHALRKPPATGLEQASLSEVEPEESIGLCGDSPILLSVNGVLGDPGTAKQHWLYEIEDDDAFRQLTASADGYRSHSTGRNLWHGHRAMSFLPSYSMMTTGIDNRRLLPPTAPEGRNEDLLFGAGVKYLYPTSLAAALPWGLPHLPQPPRSWSPETLDLPYRPGMPSLLSSMVTVCGSLCAASHVERRMAFLAEACRALADAAEPEMRTHILGQVLTERTGMVARLQELLARRTDAPDYWTADVKRIIAANTRPLHARGEPWQSEIGTTETDPDTAEQTFRNLLQHYATAIEIWPELRKARGQV